MAGRLAGKIALIVGAGQTPGETIGNGRATAIRFAEEGATVLLADVEAMLADGRRYLVGDAFTAADLTFAALLAPVIAPPEQPIVSEVTAPPEFTAMCEEFRRRPSGAFALRVYREERLAGGGRSPRR